MQKRALSEAGGWYNLEEYEYEKYMASDDEIKSEIAECLRNINCIVTAHVIDQVFRFVVDSEKPKRIVKSQQRKVVEMYSNFPRKQELTRGIINIW